MLNINQIQSLLSIIDKNHLVFIGKEFGPDFLSTDDRLVLKKFGVNWKTLYKLENDSIANAYHLGLLSDALKQQDLKSLVYSDLQAYIRAGKYLPLTQRDKLVIDAIKKQSYTSIKGLKDKIFKDFNQILVDKTRNGQEEFIREQLKEGFLNKRSISEISRGLANKTGDYNRDFDRITQYNMADAYEVGKAEGFMKTFGPEATVYKMVFGKACKYCKNAFINEDGSPRVFKLSELIANGTNIGRKSNELKPTIGPMHPYCRCQLLKVPAGFKWNPVTRRFDLPDENYKPKRERAKIRVLIAGKEHWV